MTATVAPPPLEDELRSPRIWRDPYPIFDRLRREAPVFWCEPWRAFVVTRYADVSWVLREDGRLFSTFGRAETSLSSLDPEVSASLGLLRRHFSYGLMHTDPPDHTRLRGLINRAFTPASVTAVAPRIEALANELLDDAARRGGMEVVEDYATTLPATVVAEVLGIPYDLARLKDWIAVSQAFGSATPMTAEIATRMQAMLAEARSLISEVAAARRREPRDDIISRLVAATSGDSMTEDELLSTAMTLILGAYHSTAALISNAIAVLLAAPDQAAMLRAEPDLMPTAVEEFLRYETPAPRVTRIAKVDTAIAGVAVPARSFVVTYLAAANRDPDAFGDPDRLDLRRRPNRHVSFAAGVHHCLGAPLARLEAVVALRALLARFPRIEPVGSPFDDWVPNPTMRMLRALPVQLA